MSGKTSQENDVAALAGLPRFQRAAQHCRQLDRLTLASGVAALCLAAAAGMLSRSGANSIWHPVLLNCAAALGVLGIACRSAAWVSRARRLACEPAQSVRRSARPVNEERPAWERLIARAVEIAVAKSMRIARTEEFQVAVASLLVLLITRLAWNWTASAGALDEIRFLGAGVVLAAAFGLLVLERFFAGRNPLEWPEANALAHLLRIIIGAFVLEAVALFSCTGDRVWPARLAMVAGVVPAAIALEFCVRAMLAAIARTAGQIEPPLMATSLLGRLMVWPPRPFEAMHDELHERFGIDLRQNWAFGFIRRASLPVIAVIATAGWLLTGWCEVPLSSRDIYERFGKPVAVWEPGLHIGLPWPLARTLRVENGIVHQLSASFPADPQVQAGATDADGPAPASADRLWDVSHVAENAQVISSEVNAKQSFQIVNMDVRFVYRIGSSDAAVMAVTYHCSDIEALIRSTAGRVLVHYFASRSLDGLLGEQRDALAGDIKRAVQGDLDAFASGVELMSVLVESIHPPAGAAAAYHSVQAAQIHAQAIVAEERGTAAVTINDATTQAIRMEATAAAAAQEHLAEAQIARLGFDADREGYDAAGQAFIRERYLSQLAQGLGKANLVLIDHRIGDAGTAPTIDLRAFPGGYPYSR